MVGSLPGSAKRADLFDGCPRSVSKTGGAVLGSKATRVAVTFMLFLSSNRQLLSGYEKLPASPLG
jgi:hypothetical protein